jgi:hypothetical protein
VKQDRLVDGTLFPMTWNYRICKRKAPSTDDEVEVFGIHEVYYDAEGWADAWSTDPAAITGDSASEVLASVARLSAVNAFWIVDLNTSDPIEEVHHATGHRRRCQAGPRTR